MKIVKGAYYEVFGLGFRFIKILNIYTIEVKKYILFGKKKEIKFVRYERTTDRYGVYYKVDIWGGYKIYGTGKKDY